MEPEFEQPQPSEVGSQSTFLDRIEAQHQKVMQHLTETHEARMKEWERLQSPEYIEEVRQQVLAETHADIPPPWED